VSPEGRCEDIFHEPLEGSWSCSGDRAEEGRPEMLLQTGADRRGMPFLLTSFQAIVKRKARRHNLLSFSLAQHSSRGAGQ